MTDYPQSWYPLCRSSDLKPKRLKKVRGLGRDWVVYRTEQGRLAVSQNICPHMGADLGQGKVHGEGLVCSLHQWKFTAEGKVSNKASSCSLKQSLPCEEYLGII